MDPIYLSDDSNAGEVIDLGAESNDDVIEISEIEDYKTSFKNDGQYDYLLKENKLLVEFIEKCLDLESTKGMLRVINRSLIPAFYSTTQMFRETEIITTVISKSIRKLDSDPDHKFSHVKELCGEMKKASRKFSEKQKRWKEAALLEKRKSINRSKRKKKMMWGKRKKKKPNEIENIIVSDDSDGFEVPIINLDEIASQVNTVEVPLEDYSRTSQDVGIIEIEIDNVAQDIETNNEIEIPDNDCTTSKIYFSTKNLSGNTAQDTLKSGIEDTDSSKNRPEAHVDHKKNDSNTNSAGLISLDNTLKPIGEQSKGALVYDNEISSTEISSTVNVDDNCNESVKGSQDSDLIVLDEDEKELVTTTQEVTEVKINVNPNASKVSSELNSSTASVISDDKCRGKEEQNSDDKDLIVLDEDDEAQKRIPTQKDKKENVKENVTNNEVSSKETSSTVLVPTNQKSCESNKANLGVLNEDDVTTTQRVNRDTEKSNTSIASAKDKVNHGKRNEPTQNSDLIIIDDEDDSEKFACNNKTKSLPVNEEDTLLVPHKAEEFEGTTEDKLMSRIKSIEDEISACKDKITELEEQEVNNDTMWSPYIQCEKYKSKIVQLYKELCKLTGERAVKRREVRLRAANTRSQLCVDKLEQLINTNIGHDGLPHFPDFQDVLQCVRDANKEGMLGWNRNEVMREANTLFTYCGRALQESRMRREWRDMLSLVKSEQVEDPADNDPELMARLQANRQTAVKREKDLLDRYCEMSYLLPSEECTKQNDIYSSDSENETENEVDKDITATKDTERSTTSQQNDNTSVKELSREGNQVKANITDKEPSRVGDQVKAMEALSQTLIKAVFAKPSANGLTNSYNDGSHIVRKRCTPIKLEDNKTDKRAFMYSSKTSEVSSNNDPLNILNHNFNLVTKVVLQRIELPKVGNVVKVGDGATNYPLVTDSNSVKKESDINEPDNNMNLVSEIKKEPCIDIQEELDKLGDNFTMTVIDIEDPFLLVEISSDSEDEDELSREERLPL
ncbi:hypothetical protein ABMA28_004992 [Loxostege sticticalis]|uniref:Daxx histone-binding domain-containing protein n=1 Tax=Loxostege sticticalis TaxID=481309 RepID=A0ABD0ST33_LOXSC